MPLPNTRRKSRRSSKRNFGHGKRKRRRLPRSGNQPERQSEAQLQVSANANVHHPNCDPFAQIKFSKPPRTFRPGEIIVDATDRLARNTNRLFDFGVLLV
jgi:hypothetical protein